MAPLKGKIIENKDGDGASAMCRGKVLDVSKHQDFQESAVTTQDM